MIRLLLTDAHTPTRAVLRIGLGAAAELEK